MGITLWRVRTVDGAAEATPDVATHAAPDAANAAAEATTDSASDALPQVTLSEIAPAALDTVAANTDSSAAARANADVAGIRTGAETVTGVGPGLPTASMDWRDLQAAVAECRACRLCERRTNTVFGTGDQHAALMFVGEAPGHDEDLRGEPFVGRAGQLLNRMLQAMRLPREQVYIANVVKCRPPNNRNPNPDEMAACGPFLARQIALVRPRLLVALGGVAANHLLATTDSVGRLRGRIHACQPAGGGEGIPTIVTYHPSYYLRPHSTADKAKGWQDLQRVLKLLHQA
ncbi:uracil-DNA glycosylase [Thiohalocapsa marina]|uniref:Type-4 uracil-DNA glycosylase n=2 Tax=Thiohalocapsa marina TaxID=424902 RepID=A0A5M8FTE4_9GAMM|nr:uracil-DNA glycosylase [Thiohalocapsa marina]